MRNFVGIGQALTPFFVLSLLIKSSFILAACMRLYLHLSQCTFYFEVPLPVPSILSLQAFS